MKRRLMLAAALLAVLSTSFVPTQAAEPKRAATTKAAKAPAGPQLRVAVEGGYAPFSEVGPDGKLKGFDVDIANAVCDELKLRCQLVRRDWPSIQDAVLGKSDGLWQEVDAIVASVSITDSRRQTADFSKKYYHIPARFVARKGVPFELTEAGLAGRRIGVQGATTHDQFLTAKYGSSAQIVRFLTLDEATRTLLQGDLDMVMADSLALQFGLLKKPEAKTLELVGPAFTDPGWFGNGVGIVVRKGATELLGRIDAAIDAIQLNGSYGKIAGRYFSFDINPR